jgi:type VI secretion system protein VasD
LRPGDHQSVDQPVQLGTKFIGVVAGYLNLEGSRWRAVADVPPNKTTPLAVRLDAADVTIGPP